MEALAENQTNELQQETRKPDLKEVTKNRDSNAYFEMKMKHAEDPLAIVFPARLRETGALAELLFPFDLFVNLIRLRAGIYLGLQEVTPILEQVEVTLKNFTQFVEKIGAPPASVRENQEIKKALVQVRPSYVIRPKTTEGIELALLIKRFEAGMVDLKLRADVEEWKTHANLFDELFSIMKSLREINRQMASLLKIGYKMPKKLAGLEELFNGEKEEQVQ